MDFITLFTCGTAIEHPTLHLLNQIGDRNTPRTAFGAVEHGAAAKDAQPVTENGQAQRCTPVTTIEEKAVRIDNGSRPDHSGLPQVTGQELVQAAHRMHFVPSSYQARCSGVWRPSVAGGGSSLIRYSLIFTY